MRYPHIWESYGCVLREGVPGGFRRYLAHRHPACNYDRLNINTPICVWIKPIARPDIENWS